MFFVCVIVEQNKERITNVGINVGSKIMEYVERIKNALKHL